ncbi:MAG: HAD-IA family hydrolase [Deltaproteobacteria bacterium]|nr:HAD-IA family hydrolase [Deltaproteobacteria bacterium]
MKIEGIGAVLFDAGNTLAHLDYAFIAEVLAEHGQRVSPEDLRLAEYGAKAAIDRQLAPEMAPPGSIEGLLWPDEEAARPSYFATVLHCLGIASAQAKPILAALRAHNQASCLWRVVEPDTAQVLAALRARGFTLAVISNSDGRIEADLERYGLRAHFAAVIDSHVVGLEKPDPAIFKLALERIGVRAEAALYVGDVYGIDIAGARRAGLRAVLMDPLDRYPGRLDCPRICRLAQLLELLPQQASQ